MADVIETFFERFATDSNQYYPQLSDLAGSCRFDIEGEGSWMLTITKGVLAIAKSRGDA